MPICFPFNLTIAVLAMPSNSKYETRGAFTRSNVKFLVQFETPPKKASEAGTFRDAICPWEITDQGPSNDTTVFCEGEPGLAAYKAAENAQSKGEVEMKRIDGV